MDNYTPPANNPVNPNPTPRNNPTPPPPPPPPPPVSIRTMETDASSLKASGGTRPAPELINVNAPTRGPIEEKPQDPGIKIGVPGYAGPEEKMFVPETIPQKQQTAPPINMDLSEEDAHEGGSGRAKKIILIVVFLAIAIGLGGVGYFIVYPLLFPVQNPYVTPPISETPPPPPPVALTHQSFITSDKAEIAASLGQATPEIIAPGTAPVLKEVVLRDGNGNQLVASKYLPTILTEFTESELQGLLGDDFTAFVFYDEAGAWPGYAFKLKDGVSLISAQPTINKMESFASIKNIFASDPGAMTSGGFKNGQVGGKPSRYATFAKSGAAVNYAWIENYLFITTTYPAMQEVANRIVR